jgi:hypothetical protein
VNARISTLPPRPVIFISYAHADEPDKPAESEVQWLSFVQSFLQPEEATQNLAAARKLIAECGYHRRDEELAELEDVAAARRRFADLPPRV